MLWVLKEGFTVENERNGLVPFPVPSTPFAIEDLEVEVR